MFTSSELVISLGVDFSDMSTISMFVYISMSVSSITFFFGGDIGGLISLEYFTLIFF